MKVDSRRVVLRISYKVRVHHILAFEQIFMDEIAPLIPSHGLRFLGIWRTLVGPVGEYMELWEFESMTDFDRRWNALMNDPRLLEVFEKTGPMVEEENFTLLAPVGGQPEQNPRRRDLV